MNRKNQLIPVSALVTFLLLFCLTASAEGTKELSPTPSDSVMLHTNASGFGNFAAFGSQNTTSSLNVRIKDFTSDTLYIGLSAEHNDFGLLDGAGSYMFQIVDPLGNVVFGPFIIDTSNANATTWSLAANGPDINGTGGYSTDLTQHPWACFVPMMNGDYSLQFSDGAPNAIVNVMWYDFTVRSDGEVQPGRLWSRNWALRTPPINPNDPPECQFDRPFNGVFYSYTMDGFVSKIDFDSSGFQGLSFTVAFGETGPGSSGDVIADRRSVNNANATANAADHMVFLNEPDTMEFPSDTSQCGSVALLSVSCEIIDSFCINVGVTEPGQVEVILDFNENGIYDQDTTDVLLAMIFSEADTACIPWNGLKGDGSEIEFGEDVPTIIRYSQGVQHYAAFDVEFLKNGFCVETVRPICSGVATDLLYWDDSQITDDQNTVTIDEGDPGTGQPKVQLNGCECQVDSCRTWDNFQVGDNDPNDNCQGTPLGYAEAATLNTWWYASVIIIDDIVLPFVQVNITGDSAICAGDSTIFFADAEPDSLAYTFVWSGPGGFTATGDSTGFISVEGTYYVTVTDTLTGCSAIDSAFLDVQPSPTTDITFTCVGPNQQNANVDLTVTGGQPPYTYIWSNGATTQDLMNVPPGTYSVTVTDANGCMAFDSIVVSGCCELIVTCPPTDAGTFACEDDIPPISMSGVVIVEFCDDVTISSVETDNGGEGCPGDTLFVTRVHTVTDEAGNEATCTQVFTVVDTVPPTLVTGVPDTSIICGDPITPALLGTPTYSDNCSSATVTFADDSIGFDGTCVNDVIGTVLRTFYAEDDCGNIDSSLVQEISIIDTIPPTFTAPADITIDCADDISPANTGVVTDTADNCMGVVTLSFSDLVVPGECPVSDTILRTWVATDICGNSSDDVQRILLLDTVPPTFTTPADITIDCGASIDPDSTGNIDDATDNCSGFTISFTDNIVPNGCPVSDTVFRTWVVTDDCGNSSTGEQIIIRLDTIPPTFTLPADTLINCDVSTDTINTGSVSDVADNCSTFTISFSDVLVPGECPAIDTTYRTWVVTDECLNSSTGVQTITRIDTIPPVITCPADVTIGCTDDSSPQAQGSATATDVCDSEVDITFTDSTLPPGCTNTTPLIRTWIATDNCGNSSTCSQSILIEDTEPPTFITPGDITIECDGDTSPVVTGFPVEVSDNCSSTTITYEDVIADGNCNPFTDTIFRTWIVTDVCGNSATDVQLIFRIDTVPPAFIAPADITLDCDQDPQDTTLTGSVIVLFDNCSTTTTVSFSDDTTGLTGCNGTGIILRTWQVADECDNSATSIQVITVQDTTPPTALCNDFMIDFGSSTSVTITPEDIDNGSFDNCGDVTLSLSQDTFNCEEFIGQTSIPVILTVTDECGNSSTCEAQVTGMGGLLEITCPDDIIINLNPGECTAIVDYTVTAEAICGGTDIIITQIDTSGLTSGDAFPIGVTVQTYQATNGSDTVTCSFTITVIEADIPVVMACNDVINISVDANCEAHIFVDMILEGDQYTCFDDFIITVEDFGTDTGWIVVFGLPLNECYTVTVTDPETGISCWGIVCLEDKLPPQIVCACPIGGGGDSCVVSCLEVDQLLDGNIPPNLQPDVTDNCGIASIDILDIFVDDDGCGEGTIQITWIVTDSSGMSATCAQEFEIEPLSIDSIVFPPNFIGECGSSSHPDITGWPQVNGIDLTDESGLCNLFLGYWDHVLQDCGGGIKIVRTWTVLDWCTLEIVEFTQLIKLVDDEGPILTCPQNITVGTDFWYCFANVSVPRPIASDVCSDVVDFDLSVPGGIVVQFGNNFVVNDLDLGTYVATWIVSDLCGNSSTCTFTITVEDDVVPVANCDEHTIVSLTNDGPFGITLVPAEVFDDGSYDNCGPVTFRARRMDSCIDFDWTTEGACVDHIPGGVPPVNSRDRGTVHRPCVPFACCDVGAGPIMIELEVTDAAGNVNYCMVEAEVQDKIAPFVECPPDIIISCDFWFPVVEGTFVDGEGNHNGSLDEDPLSHIFGNMFDAFRWPESVREDIIINDPNNELFSQPHFWGIDGWADDNCEVNLAVRVRVFNDCSGDDLPGNPPPGAVRLIERRFTASDGNEATPPNVCTQRIWVVDFDPFFITDNTCNNSNPNDGVIWPCDVVLTECPDEIGDTGEPIIFDDICSLIGVAFEDTRFDFVDGACFKILREWSIIDWCQYNPLTGEGLWKYVQVIKVHDEDGSEFLDCPVGPVVLCVADEGVSLPDNNQAFLGEENPLSSSCSAHLNLCQTVHEPCGEVVVYDVKLYMFNTNEFIQIKPTTTVPVDSAGNAELCFDTRQSTIQAIRLNGVPYNSPFCGDYHRILWTVGDGCGNFSTCEYLFRLEDCKQPSPVCINGLSTVVMPIGGEVTVWAKDFDASSFDDCTPAEELLFSFNGDAYQPSFTYTCDNVPAFGVELSVNIWVADGGTDDNCNGQISWEERNKDFCTTTIVITDNNNVCEDFEGSVLEGHIYTEHEDAIESVEVNLEKDDSPIYSMVTTDNGKYVLHVPDNVGQRYDIVPERNDQHRNGVSTLDLVRIQKHLLGLENFSSPYQYIAADANSNQQVSAIDLVEIRKLILGVYTEFPNNQSWRFVDPNAEIADESHPWPFEEIISYQHDGNSHYDFDFIGVKIGDVNNTVQANATQILPRGGRRILNVHASAEENPINNDIINVMLTIPENVAGLQWTLETKDLEFVSIHSEDVYITEYNIGLLGDGIITMSWNNESIIASKTKAPITFILQFKGTTATEVLEKIFISNRVTEAEAYTFENEILDISFSSDITAGVDDFVLYQNEPNPWNGTTVIRFNLPEASKAKLSLYDLTGKLIRTIEHEYTAGHHAITLTKKEIPAHGVLYYRLESGPYSASKKMIHLE